MVRACCARDLVAAGPAGFDDELFAAKLAQVVGALADGVVRLRLPGQCSHLVREVSHGEPLGCDGQGEHGLASRGCGAC